MTSGNTPDSADRPVLGMRRDFKPRPSNGKPGNDRGDGHTKLLRGLQGAGAKVTIDAVTTIYRDVIIVAADRYTVTFKHPAESAEGSVDETRRTLLFKSAIASIEYHQTPKQH